jgi:glycine/serine hydroxymethyltransferase
MQEVNDLLRALESDEARSTGGISLTANESCLSRTARSMQSSPLGARYHLGGSGHRERDDADVTISGGGLMRMALPVSRLEHRALEAAHRLFGAQVSDLRPLSGMHATICVIAMLTEPGDRIMSVSPEHGGHNATGKLVERLGRRSCFLPRVNDEFSFDVAGAADVCSRDRVAMVVLDFGTTPFPLPVRALRTALGSTMIVYDGSHNMGLIAGGAFPNPLSEGADVLSGSTHKSFPGPQKGMVHFASEALGRRFVLGLERAMISSQHTGEALALYVTMLEMNNFAEAYARATIHNAQRLAAALSSMGFTVIGRDNAATQSGAFWLLPPPRYRQPDRLYQADALRDPDERPPLSWSRGPSHRHAVCDAAGHDRRRHGRHRPRFRARAALARPHGLHSQRPLGTRQAPSRCIVLLRFAAPELKEHQGSAAARSTRRAIRTVVGDGHRPVQADRGQERARRVSRLTIRPDEIGSQHGGLAKRL